MAKCKFESRTELTTKVLRGVNVLADNVAATLGPKGRNVILHQKGKEPIITNIRHIINCKETVLEKKNQPYRTTKTGAIHANNVAFATEVSIIP